MSWETDEVKQLFSEMLHAAERDGPQIIARHGKEVAVLIDINEYRGPTGGAHDFVTHLMNFPSIESAPGEPDVFDEIEAERKFV